MPFSKDGGRQRPGRGGPAGPRSCTLWREVGPAGRSRKEEREREGESVCVCVCVSVCVGAMFILGCAPVFEQGFVCLRSEVCL